VTSRPPLGSAKPSSPPFLKSDPVPQHAFVADGGGTNVVLAAPHESALCQAYRRAMDAGSYRWPPLGPVTDINLARA
jgi:hypothetical protein